MTLDLDLDRRLALAYVPVRLRPALEALWRLDVTFASVLATGRDRMVTRIRLAWWRDALEKLDREAAPPEPVLQLLAAHVLPAGVPGVELAAMEEGWAVLLSDAPLGAGDLNIYAARRGGLLFRYSAGLLGGPGFPVEPAGRLWALADLGRHSSNPREVESAIEAADGDTPGKWPRALRPLGMLAMLARRDAGRGVAKPEAPGSPARIFRMLRHRLTGH